MPGELIGSLQDGREVLRFSRELGADALAEGKPNWIHILPGGSEVLARDGRRFKVESHSDIVANTELPLLIDWEHASESGDTRAAGWIEELKIEPAEAGSRAGIWGRAEWTGKGTGEVRERQFRFLSPVVVGKRLGVATLAVEKLRSVALTNRPALRMHGIEAFTEQLSMSLGPIATHEHMESDDMSTDTFRKAIASAFGLKPDATDEQLAEAAKPIIESAKSGNEAASLRAACAEAVSALNEERKKVSTLETELASFRKNAQKSTVEAFFDTGSREGKIPPAAREKWLAFALESDSNFETFKNVIYPDLAAVSPGRAPKSKPGKKGVKQKFSEKSPHGVNREALKSMGFTEAQILESEAEVFHAKSEPDDDEDDDEDEGDEGDGDDNDEDGED